jgi:hypothetical protein
VAILHFNTCVISRPVETRLKRLNPPDPIHTKAAGRHPIGLSFISGGRPTR